MPTFRQDNKLGDSVPLIKTPDIGDKQVTERKLADGSVTSSKLSTEIANMLSLLTTRISAFKVADNLSSLPTEENTIGWLVDNHLYVYVGNGSTPESGMYQDCGELRGPQGIQGEQGLSGLNGKSAYDIWTEQPGNEDKSEIDFLEFTRGSKGDKGDQGERGYDISNIEQIVKSTEDGGKNIIRVTRSDGWSKVFEIFNGSKGSKGDKGTSIVKLEQTRKTTESSGLNTIEATLGDGTKESFEIYNGAKGKQGDKGEKGDKGDQGEIGPQGNSGIADASNKTLVNDAITGGETDFLSAEVGKLGILTYDCSKGGTVTHTTLQDAINSVPTTFQKVGLTITYKSGDTIYRYTLKANAWSANPENWFSVEDKLSDLNIIRNETIKNLSKCEYGCPTSLYDSLQYIVKDDIFVQLVSNKQYPRKITKLTYKGIDAGTLKIYKVKIVDDIAQAPILIKVVSGQTASIKETELDVLLSKDEYIGVSGGFSYSNNADSEYSTMLVSSTGGEVSKTRSQYLGYTLYGESYSSRIDEIENATEENHLKTEQNTKDISALSKKVDEISSDKLYERKDFVDGMYYAAESRYRTDGNYGKVIHTPNMEIQGVILTIPKDKVGSYGFSVNFWDSNGGYIGNWFTNHTFTELQHNGFTKDNSVLFSKDDINTAISQKKYNNVQYYTIEVFDFTDTYYDIPQDADIVVSKYNSRQNLISENIIVVDEFGGGDYTSLQEAIDTRKDIGARGKPLVIFLMPGTYRMSQTTSENRGYCSYRTISIIGANKDSCIIRNDDGVYNTGASGTYIDSAPLKMAGNCYLENLTIISTATNSTSEASENKSYCVHLDFFANEGSRLTVHNCRMINDHNCCIGIGLHNGYTIEISYCELESTNTNGNGWGTIIAHEGSEKGDCKLILKDNVIVDHTNNGITIDHPYNGNIVLDLVRNVVVNNGSPITMDNKYHTLSSMCFGNNRNEMNKQT